MQNKQSAAMMAQLMDAGKTMEYAARPAELVAVSTACKDSYNTAVAVLALASALSGNDEIIPPICFGFADGNICLAWETEPNWQSFADFVKGAIDLPEHRTDWNIFEHRTATGLNDIAKLAENYRLIILPDISDTMTDTLALELRKLAIESGCTIIAFEKAGNHVSKHAHRVFDTEIDTSPETPGFYLESRIRHRLQVNRGNITPSGENGTTITAGGAIEPWRASA